MTDEELQKHIAECERLADALRTAALLAAADPEGEGRSDA